MTLERRITRETTSTNRAAGRAPSTAVGPAAVLREWDRTDFREWQERSREIGEIAGPIVESPAFERLAAITFLGILSPRFADTTVRPTLMRRASRPAVDGSRRSHSLGVALLNLDMARELGFSETTQRYAAAYGLLHDIGNWPLSHTGEYAFSRLTHCTTRELRRDMITGAKAVPTEYSVHRCIVASGLNVDWLLAILEHRSECLAGELSELARVLASPLIPDAFEGMWRCGRVIGVKVPRPETLVNSLRRDATHTICLRPGSETRAVEFWRSKMRIYGLFLNRRDVIELESAWSQAIIRDFANVNLETSLYLSEDDIVQRVTARGLPKDVPFSRYKHPVNYSLGFAQGQSLPPNVTLEQLSAIFVGKPMDM